MHGVARPAPRKRKSPARLARDSQRSSEEWARRDAAAAELERQHRLAEQQREDANKAEKEQEARERAQEEASRNRPDVRRWPRKRPRGRQQLSTRRWRKEEQASGVSVCESCYLGSDRGV